MPFILFSCFRVRVSRGASARLLPGPARLRHLSDHTHGVLGGVQRCLRHGLVLRQPKDEAQEIHI